MFNSVHNLYRITLFTVVIEIIISFQHRRVFESWYAVVQFWGNKFVRSSCLIIGEVVEKPVIVSAFGLECFSLQLDAFLAVIYVFLINTLLSSQKLMYKIQFCVFVHESVVCMCLPIFKQFLCRYTISTRFFSLRYNLKAS